MGIEQVVSAPLDGVQRLLQLSHLHRRAISILPQELEMSHDSSGKDSAPLEGSATRAQGADADTLLAPLLQQSRSWSVHEAMQHVPCISIPSQHGAWCLIRAHDEAGKAAYLSIAISVLHNSPGQLCDGEGQRVAELQVGPPGLKVASAEVLTTGSLALGAGV